MNLHQVKILILLILVTPVFAGCANSNATKEQRGEERLEDIKRVQEKHTDELMSLPGVVGVYIGLRDFGEELCIKVMVRERTRELEERIPSELEGYPVEIEETGEIRPLEE